MNVALGSYRLKSIGESARAGKTSVEDRVSFQGGCGASFGGRLKTVAAPHRSGGLMRAMNEAEREWEKS